MWRPGLGLIRLHEFDAESRHLVLLCKNEDGLPQPVIHGRARRLLEGFYIKPRIDLELLREHSEGLIALSACLAGEIPKRILQGRLRRRQGVRPADAGALRPGQLSIWSSRTTASLSRRR